MFAILCGKNRFTKNGGAAYNICRLAYNKVFTLIKSGVVSFFLFIGQARDHFLVLILIPGTYTH